MKSSVPALVTIEQGIPLADSRKIAKRLEIAHRSFFRMILEYQEEIEKDFGLLRIEIASVKNPGERGTKYSKYALLTEDQTYAYLAYSQNTKEARQLKRDFVKEFLLAQEKLRVLQFAPNATLIGLTSRNVRMVGIVAQWTDAEPQSDEWYKYCTEFIAEAEAMTPEDRTWGGKYILSDKQEIYLLM